MLANLEMVRHYMVKSFSVLEPESMPSLSPHVTIVLRGKSKDQGGNKHAMRGRK